MDSSSNRRKPGLAQSVTRKYVGDGVYVEYQQCSDTVCVYTHRLSNTGEITEHFVHLDSEMLLDLLKFLGKMQSISAEQLKFAEVGPDRMEDLRHD